MSSKISALASGSPALRTDEAAIARAGASAKLTLDQIVALALKRNLLINGAFQVWQRGTSFAVNASAYTADRWQAYRGVAGCTISRATGVSGQYAIRVQRDSGNAATTAIVLQQCLETVDCYALGGLPITLKFRGRCGANYSAASSALSILVFSGTGTDENSLGAITGYANVIVPTIALSTTQQTFEATGTIPAGARQLFIQATFTPAGTAGANDWFEWEEMQIVVGSKAGDFPYRSFAEELTLCQRYYEKSYNQVTAPGTATTNPGVVGFTPRAADQLDRIPIWFKARKRSNPTVTVYNYNSGAAGSVRDTIGAVDRAATTENDGENCTIVRLTANPNINNTHYFHWAASAEL